jgi:hypothetical protein
LGGTVDQEMVVVRVRYKAICIHTQKQASEAGEGRQQAGKERTRRERVCVPGGRKLRAIVGGALLPAVGHGDRREERSLVVVEPAFHTAHEGMRRRKGRRESSKRSSPLCATGGSSWPPVRRGRRLPSSSSVQRCCCCRRPPNLMETGLGWAGLGWTGLGRYERAGPMFSFSLARSGGMMVLVFDNKSSLRTEELTTPTTFFSQSPNPIIFFPRRRSLLRRGSP